MDQGQLTHRGTIYPWQCDHMGPMNVMWYSGKFDEASWQILASLGLTSPRFRKEGVRMAAVEQRIEYKRKLQAGDTVTIRSRVLEVGNRSIRFSHEMKNDETGETAAISVIAGVTLTRRQKRQRRYLRTCASARRPPSMDWRTARKSSPNQNHNPMHEYSPLRLQCVP